MKDQTRVIAALLIGAAAGAAIGLLLAPEKGETLREGIADYIGDLVDAAKNKAQSTTSGVKEYSNNVYEKAKSKLSGVLSDAADYKDSAANAVNDLKDKAETKIDEAKAKLKSGANDLNHSVQNS